jgi:DNA-directed RNA polymerase subunit M/transcription elongation factor TFIIS
MTHRCPLCSAALKPQNGWLICQPCGFRGKIEKKHLDENNYFSNYLKLKNRNGGKHKEAI